MFNKPNLFHGGESSAQRNGQRPAGTNLAAASAAQPAEAAGPSAAREPQAVGREEAPVVAGESRLIVGPEVKLKGAEILDCDTLVVEG